MVFSVVWRVSSQIFGRWLVALWLSGAAAITPARVRAEEGQPLGTRLGAAVAGSASSTANWGVLVVSARDGRTLFETNSQRLFIPASNTKLFTVATALDRLGGDFRIKTSILARKGPDRLGTLAGDLVVYGRGDPTFTQWSTAEPDSAGVGRLAEAIVQAGINRVRGDLVCHQGYFRGGPYGDGWAWDDLAEEYAGAATALSLNDNVVRLVISAGSRPGATVRVKVQPFLPSDMQLEVRALTGTNGQRTDLRLSRLPGDGRVLVQGVVAPEAVEVVRGVTVRTPALYLGEALKGELRRRGVRVDGRVRPVDWRDRDGVSPGDGVIELASVYSASFGDLAAGILKPSNNQQAQVCWFQVGAETESYPSDAEAGRPIPLTTTESSQKALSDFLGRAGIRASEVVIGEGSGLSRANLCSPASLVAVLRYMSSHSWAAAWREAFPVGGVDGTLKNRFTSGPARTNVRAKTGSLRMISSLAGYVTTADGEPLLFSVMVNNYGAGSAKVRAEIDRLVEILAEARLKPE